MYRSVFVQTFIKLALPALVAAGAYDYSPGHSVSSLTVLGWALLACLVGALIALAWSFVGSPATTLVGRALRHAVEALLALPIAAVLADARSGADLASLGPLLVPTLIGVALAFAVSYLSNVTQTPPAVAPVGPDFVGTS